MKIIAILALSIACAAQTPVPANLTGAEQVTTVNLGSVFKWSMVEGATYNIYRSQQYDCNFEGGIFNPKKINSAPITATTYTDNPNPPLPLGGYCYGVTAVINGNESVYSNTVPIVLGDKIYISVTTSDPGGTYPSGSGIQGATVTLLQDGVSIFSQVTNADGNTVGVVRLLSTSIYKIDILLPDGTAFHFPAPAFGNFQDVRAIESSYNVLSVDPDNGDFVTFNGVQLGTEPIV